MEFDEEKYKREQIERRLHFARFCWKHRNELTPEGKLRTAGQPLTWEKRFEQMEGISLEDYVKERKKERNQKEKKLSRSK
tara:strand:- start:34 stop:273 length:240 start_codon:yes stop_codon:yes gene_type:complete